MNPAGTQWQVKALKLAPLLLLAAAPHRCFFPGLSLSGSPASLMCNRAACVSTCPELHFTSLWQLKVQQKPLQLYLLQSLVVFLAEL